MAGMLRRRQWSRYHLTLVFASLVSACAEGAGPGAPVASVDVSPQSAPVQVSTTIQLTATVRDSNGVQLNGRHIDWSSSDPTVATVNGSGTVTGVLPGPVSITASSEGNRERRQITVMPGPATRWCLPPSPTSPSLVPIAPAIVVTARDAYGNTATGFVGEVTMGFAVNPGVDVVGDDDGDGGRGVATFSNLIIDRSSTVQAQATSGSLTSATTPP
jgi:hypothetical protein